MIEKSYVGEREKREGFLKKGIGICKKYDNKEILRTH